MIKYEIKRKAYIHILDDNLQNYKLNVQYTAGSNVRVIIYGIHDPLDSTVDAKLRLIRACN